MRCSSTQCLATPSKSSFGGSGMQCNPVVLEVVDKCLYLPRQIWQGRWTNVSTSPVITLGRTLKAISRPTSARAAGKK